MLVKRSRMDDLELEAKMSKLAVTYNRLQNEHSPYLLQHANNPVDWYPWGEEAFTVAKQENKPIFLRSGGGGGT